MFCDLTSSHYFKGTIKQWPLSSDQTSLLHSSCLDVFSWKEPLVSSNSAVSMWHPLCHCLESVSLLLLQTFWVMSPPTSLLILVNSKGLMLKQHHWCDGVQRQKLGDWVVRMDSQIEYMLDESSLWELPCPFPPMKTQQDGAICQEEALWNQSWSGTTTF